MKTLSIALIFLVSVLSIVQAKDNKEHDMYEYDSLFIEIGDKRVGLEQSTIKKTDNPFIMAVKKQISEDGGEVIIKQQIVYTLHAILGKKVKINNEWYNLNDKLGYYTIRKIKQNSVLLASASEQKELFIRKDNAKNFQFSSK